MHSKLNPEPVYFKFNPQTMHFKFNPKPTLFKFSPLTQITLPPSHIAPSNIVLPPHIAPPFTYCPSPSNISRPPRHGMEALNYAEVMKFALLERFTRQLWGKIGLSVSALQYHYSLSHSIYLSFSLYL